MTPESERLAFAKDLLAEFIEEGSFSSPLCHLLLINEGLLFCLQKTGSNLEINIDMNDRNEIRGKIESGSVTAMSLTLLTSTA